MISSLYLIDDDYRYIERINFTCKYEIQKTIYRGYVFYTWLNSKATYSIVGRDTSIKIHGVGSRGEAMSMAFKQLDALIQATF